MLLVPPILRHHARVPAIKGSSLTRLPMDAAGVPPLALLAAGAAALAAATLLAWIGKEQVTTGDVITTADIKTLKEEPGGVASDGHLFARRPDIDGLRSVAVAGVVIFHMDPNWLPGGFTGVDIFFVISGFVVTGSLLRPRGLQTMSAGEYFLAFYSRRVKRCVPKSREPRIALHKCDSRTRSRMQDSMADRLPYFRDLRQADSRTRAGHRCGDSHGSCCCPTVLLCR